MPTLRWWWASGRALAVVGSVGLVAVSLATTLLGADARAQRREARHVCTQSAQVLCGQHDVGPGIASPVLADNGADIGVIWTVGTPTNHAIQFARIDERAQVIETIVPIAHTSGDIAIAGANGGFLVAYRSAEGTSIVRVDRDGQVFGERRSVPGAAATIDLVPLDQVGGGAGMTALVLEHGAVVRLAYFDGNGVMLDAPPRGRVLYGIGKRTRVFVVPFASAAPSGIGSRLGGRLEAQAGDTVVATVSRALASYTFLRAGQPLGGSSNRTGQLELTVGAGGVNRLVMQTEDGSYHDAFTPAAGPAVEHNGVVGGRRPGGRGLAGEANIRDRIYLATSANSGVEVGLLGTYDGASRLVVARISVRPRRGSR